MMSPTLPAEFTVRITPRASRDEVVGWADGVLHVRVHAPPVDGRANEALVEALAEYGGIPRSRITIVRGATSRVKRICVEVD